MQNENLIDLFQVEELEERLENCWQGEEWQNQGYKDVNGVQHDNWQKVPCGTPDYEMPDYSVPQQE